MTKMGQKRIGKRMTNYEKWKEEQLKNPDVKKEYDALKPKYNKIRKGIKPISDKRKAQMPEYNSLVVQLTKLCGNKSELSSNAPDWQSAFRVDPHHIRGRIGKLFLDPFNLICLTRDEHAIENDHREGCHTKEQLEQIVYPIRIKQGFIKEV